MTFSKKRDKFWARPHNVLVGLLTALGLLLASSSSSANQTTIEIGSFKFELPAKWSINGENDRVVLLRSNDPTEPASVQISNPSPYSASKRDAFIAYLQKLTPALPVATWQITPARLRNSQTAFYASASISSAGKQQRLVPVAVFANKQMIVLTLSDTDDANLDRQKSFGKILSSLVTEPSSAGDWPKPDNTLEGFYATIGSTKSLSSLARVNNLVGINGLLLDDEGRFGLTETAMMASLGSFCVAHADICGRYDTDEQSITTWRTSTPLEQRLGLLRTEQRSLALESDQTLVVGGVRYQRIAPPQVKTIEGRFRSASTQLRDDGKGTLINAYQETILTFTGNGGFEQTGFEALTQAATNTPISLSSHPSSIRGRYEIDGFTLQLTYEDKTTHQRSLFLLNDVPVIDGSMYQRLRPIQTLIKKTSPTVGLTEKLPKSTNQ